MIEATCAACGALNRVAEADLPAGAKFFPCASCKSRVAVPAAAAAKLGAAMPPLKAPPPTAMKVPAIPVPKPAAPSDVIDLADLPAPKRNSALGPEASKPAPRSGLSAAADADLPAPKARPASPLASAPPASLDLDELLAPTNPRLSAAIDLPAPKAAKPAAPTPRGPSPFADLPAPKAAADLPAPRAPGLADLPSPKSPGLGDRQAPRAAGLADLPSPKSPGLGDRQAPRAAGLTDLPSPKSTGDRSAPRAPGLADLPAPRAPGLADLPAPRAPGVADLPAPRTADLTDVPARKAATPLADLPAPRAPGLADLPAPRAPGLADLPAPKTADPADGPARKVATPLADLPAPRAGLADLPAPRAAGLADLPAPKTPRGIADLPSPKAAPAAKLATAPAPKPAGVADLPAPKTARGIADLPAPKVPNDLPAPKQGTTDVAPFGFFDDLPQRARTQAPSQDVAPKGFFDDLPQPAKSTSQTPPTQDLAPLGFFDDLPQPASPSSGAQDLAPLGFFDDLPGPAKAQPPPAAAKGFFDDLPGPPARAQKPTASRLLDLEDSGATPLPAPSPLDALELESGPELELNDPFAAPPRAPEPVGPPPVGTPPASAVPVHAFDDLDLSKPTAPPIRFDAPSKRSSVPQPATSKPPGSTPLDNDSGLVFKRPGADAELELQDSPSNRARAAAQLGPKPKPAPPPAKPRNKKLILGAALALAAAGAGGFVVYRRHAAKAAHQAEIDDALGAMHRAQASTEPDRWQRIARTARQVLELDEREGEALAAGAEALLADSLATGAPSTGAKQMIADAVEAGGGGGPGLARAQALSAITARQPDRAIGKLKPLAAANPKDGTLALYLGWAYEASGDMTAAVASYDIAAATPLLNVPALSGRGRAKLALSDLEGARADFTAVLEASKDHIGAQVGLAAALPPTQTQQQEQDLLAILQRKDIAKADPRAVAQAYVRAGDIANHAGRLDVARERYKKALAAVPNDLAATAGLAEAELHDGRTDAAADLISKALAQSKDDVRSQLVQAEIEVKQRQYGVAATRLKTLAQRTPPLAPLEKSRLQLVTGRMLDAQGQDEAAIDAYVEGAKAAGDLDLAPTLAAVTKLAGLAKAAADAKDTKSAEEMRNRADQLLGALADHARQDPQLALTLGIAYLSSGDAAKAEPWLREAADARQTDADAQYQLGRALALLGKTDDAIETLRKAAALDAARADIGLELARTYEALGRGADASDLYDKLLAAPEVGLELRARAGRFFARQGRWEKAAQQGQIVLAADPQSAAGYFLKGVGLFAQNKLVDAKQAFQRAVELDRDPQFLEGLGRAAEAMAATSGDREQQETALRSYIAAAEGDPKLFGALAGQGRLYVARHEAQKAIAPLTAANKLDPKDPDVPYLMGAALHELQQNAQALPWLETSIKLRPNALASWMVGQIYRDQNQGGAAAAAMNAATRQALADEKATGKQVPWLTDALYSLGRVELDLHEEAAARDAWEKYVGRNPPPSAQLTDVKQQLGTSLRR